MIGSDVLKSLTARVRHLCRPKELFLHDGQQLRRYRLGTGVQFAVVGALALSTAWTGVSAMQMVGGASTLTAVLGDAASHQAKLSAMRQEVSAMSNDIAAIRAQAAQRAAQIEKRQAFLVALLQKQGDADTLQAMVPEASAPISNEAKEATAPLDQVADAQIGIARQAQAKAERRYVQTAAFVRRLGLDPIRFHEDKGAMGGPYEPIGSASVNPDPAFKALFSSWKKLDQIENGVVAIPSSRPVRSMTLTSTFGVRTDPFRGGRAMHAGLDISGPLGTPIYATADGIVGRSQWVRGYGNLIEIEHGKGIQTRFGHLSQSLVQPMRRVKRGDLIGLMGSTGRSTGSHLHYEVRIDGRAVNPLPFLQSSDYLLNMQARAQIKPNVAVGGPAIPAVKK